MGVYAPVDALSLHTRFTTETKVIDGQNTRAADPVSSNLDAEVLIRTAKTSGCDCIHPSYGFPTENAEFAERCISKGLLFIGPTPEGFSLLSDDKIRARERAQSLEIPVVPGSARSLTSLAEV